MINSKSSKIIMLEIEDPKECKLQPVGGIPVDSVARITASPSWKQRNMVVCQLHLIVHTIMLTKQ
jgi:hypothetical protein